MDPLPRRSAAFDAGLARAWPRPALWRCLLGALLAGGVWLLTVAALAGLAGWLPLAAAADERLFALAYLMSFAGLIGGLALALRLLQGRGIAVLVGPAPGFRRDFRRGAGVVALIIVAALPLVLLGERPVRQLAFGTWALWAPLGALAVLVQVAAEELAFRGYLQGGLAARFRSPLVWWLLPALAFGLLHWNPAFGPNAPLAVATATLIGLAAGDATARRGNLGLAMGFHFANNLVAVLLMAPPSPLDALALYQSSVDPSDTASVRAALLGNLGVVALAYGIWIGLRRPPACRLHSSDAGSI